LLNGTDGELAGATTDLGEAINELSQAVGLATLNTVQILDEVIQSMSGSIEFLVSNANLIDERTKAIESNTNTIIDQNQKLASKQDDMTDMQRETLEKMAEQSRMLNNVVGYFGSIQMGQNFGKSFQDSVLKLGVIRLRLTRWSQSVGLGNIDNAQSLENIQISDEDIPMVKELLGSIMESFDDAERTSNRIKKRNPSVGVLNPANEFDDVAASLHTNMNTLVKARQGEVELQEQTGLTLYEEKNFTRLIEDISDSVNDLVNLFPAVQEKQQKLCEEEVSQMNKNENALTLLKDAADGQDNLLSKTVTKVIQSTTAYNNSVVFQGTNSGFQIGNNKGKISNVRFH
jgi:Prion-inhibition and propagation